MNKDVLLSFIVPCFNVENYVQQCLDSIYSCDLDEKQFEVLCIDDCSPDGTRTILEQNEKQHGNLRIIVNSKNKGLGATRNTGIREAKGEYLWFVDSDDQVTVSGLSTLIQKTMEQELDVLCFNYKQVSAEGEVLSDYVVFQETPTLDGYSFVKSVFGKDIVLHLGYVVRFLYRVEFLRSHDLLFPENVYWEDTVFMPRSLFQADRVSAVSDVLYSYRLNSDSISSKFERSYPANAVFDLAFMAGGELLHFSEEVMDKDLKAAIRNVAVQKYINGFPVILFRTSLAERRKFYELIRVRKLEVEGLKEVMKPLPKVLLWPMIGKVLAECFTFFYKITH